MRVNNEAGLSDVLDAFHWVGAIIGKEFDAKTARQEPQFARDRILALHFWEQDYRCDQGRPKAGYIPVLL
jgi:hypothetical protein